MEADERGPMTRLPTSQRVVHVAMREGCFVRPSLELVVDVDEAFRPEDGDAHAHLHVCSGRPS